MTIARRSRAYATAAIVAFAASVAVTSLLAQAAPEAVATNVANDPDVLGAERLFSAWMEGQIAYRGLPGIAVGVVSDQQLVWASGLRLRGRQGEDPDDAGDQVSHGIAQQALRRDRDHAAARGGQAPPR